jgi:hypothetical protein
MPKAVVIDSPTVIRFIDQKTGEIVELTSKFVIEEAASGPVHFVHCDRCGKRVRLTKTANPSNIIIHRSSNICDQQVKARDDHQIPSSDSLLEMAGVQEELQKRSRAHTVTQGSGKRSKRN